MTGFQHQYLFKWQLSWVNGSKCIYVLSVKNMFCCYTASYLVFSIIFDGTYCVSFRCLDFNTFINIVSPKSVFLLFCSPAQSSNIKSRMCQSCLLSICYQFKRKIPLNLEVFLRKFKILRTRNQSGSHFKNLKIYLSFTTFK